MVNRKKHFSAPLPTSDSEHPVDTGAHIEFDGLGTHWYVDLPDMAEFPTELSEILRGVTGLFDDTYSRFHDESLIGQLNIHKKLLHPPEELIEMLKFARSIYDTTDKAFDISVGGTLQRLGYGDTHTARSVVPDFWNEVKLNRDEIAIPSESAIDLGGFGKGWLLDKLAALLEQHGYIHYLINGGGDIVLSATEPIELGLEHPYDPAKVIGTTKITKGALAVSSTVKRRWSVRDKAYHHIIEPTTDRATESPILTTYVRAETALIADTLATVLLLRPAYKSQLEKKFGVKAILLTSEQIL